MTHEQKAHLTYLLARFTSLQVQVHEYNWNQDLSGPSAYSELICDIKKMNLDFNKFTKDDAKLFGFYEYKVALENKKEEIIIYLLPLYLYQAIPDGTVLYSIMGRKIVKQGDNLSSDNRAGYLAYGVKVV